MVTWPLLLHLHLAPRGGPVSGVNKWYLCLKGFQPLVYLFPKTLVSFWAKFRLLGGGIDPSIPHTLRKLCISCCSCRCSREFISCITEAEGESYTIINSSLDGDNCVRYDLVIRERACVCSISVNGHFDFLVSESQNGV